MQIRTVSQPSSSAAWYMIVQTLVILVKDPRMRWPGLVSALSFVVLVGGLSACKPNYPNCESDADCPGHKEGREFCVNNQCQQCRPGPEGKADCPPGTQCNAGRCDKVQGFCNKHSDCPSGLCQNNRCVACKDDSGCPGGGRCSAGKCEADSRKPCKTSDECAETEDCVQGRCTPAGKRYVGDAKCQLQTVYFGFNEFELTGISTGVVDKDAECVKSAQRPVSLVGHTDSRGTPEYNLALSDKRAQAVRRRMGALGVPEQNMSIVPRGELDASGTDEASYEKDRSVEVNWR